MKRFFSAFSARALITTLAVTLSAAAFAQPFKMTTPIAPGVAVPDKIESSLGTLNLNYGYPSADTVEKIYDNLDRSRALQAYLMAIPIVNQAGMRDSMNSATVPMVPAIIMMTFQSISPTAALKV